MISRSLWSRGRAFFRMGCIVSAVAILFPVVTSCVPFGPRGVPGVPSSIGANTLGREVQRSAQREVDRARRQVVEHVKGQIQERVIQEVTEALGMAHGNIKPEEEYFLGRTVIADLLTDYGNRLVGISGTGREAKPTPEYEYVSLVAGVVFEAAERVRERSRAQEREQTGLRVAIVAHEVPNAYATPGGFVMITTGMLGLLSTEDELAAVLAHEAAHINLGHGVAALGRERVATKISDGVDRINQAVGIERDRLVGEMAGQLRDYGNAVTSSLRNGYDKRWEYQADERAANVLWEAGYDSSALLAVIAKVDEWQAGRSEKAGLAATHPTGDERTGALSTLPEHRLEGSEREQVAAQRAARFEGKLPLPEVATDDWPEGHELSSWAAHARSCWHSGHGHRGTSTVAMTSRSGN